MVDITKIYGITLRHYERAKGNLPIEKRALLEHSAAVSDAIPGYAADVMEFGDYLQDNFAVLFIDIRSSTARAIKLGPEKTFLTMHAYVPAMLECIKHYKGNVIDIMGDGLMVFFGGKKSELTNMQAIQNAGLCGKDMLIVKDEVTNKILKNDDIPWAIDCGVGIDYGDVIVTKIGINNIYDVKAYGNCVNKASKYSGERNKVIVSKAVREKWPSSEGGLIRFAPHEDGYILSQK